MNGNPTGKVLTKEMRDKYVESGGAGCPFCESYAPRTDGSGATKCPECEDGKPHTLDRRNWKTKGESGMGGELTDNLWTPVVREVMRRPYMPGEGMDGIFVDKGVFPEAGGFVFSDTEVPPAQWYVPPREPL